MKTYMPFPADLMVDPENLSGLCCLCREFRRGHKACPWCIQGIFFYDLPVKTDNNGIFFDSECVGCPKKLRVNLFQMKIRMDQTYRIVNYTKENLERLDSELKNMVEHLAFYKLYIFSVACGRKCIGRYKRITLKNVAKHIWIVDKMKLSCLSCGRPDLIPLDYLRLLYMYDLNYYCRDCVYIRDKFQYSRRLDYEDYGKLYAEKNIKTEDGWKTLGEFYNSL